MIDYIRIEYSLQNKLKHQTKLSKRVIYIVEIFKSYYVNIHNN